MFRMLSTIHPLDVCLFALVLLGSLSIGIYYSRRTKSSAEYLQGRRQLGLVPVSISMMVSFISAITMQGVPAEVYAHGLYQYLPSLIGIWGSFVAIWTFLPLYYNLKLVSVFQYLELRYSSAGPALLATSLNIVTQTFYMGIATIGPAQVLQSVLGTPTWLNVVLMVIVCTIYTTIGGIRAVVWTDVLQAGVMFAGIIAVIIIGSLKLDGSVNVWQEMEQRGKLDINWSPSPFVRNNVWIGCLSLAISNFKVYQDQSAMMRYLTLDSISKAKWTIVVGALGFAALSLLCACAAVIMFTYYSQVGCDPLAEGRLYSANQLLVYFVATILHYPGVPGLFVAAIVSSTLSSVSSVQNALCAVTWQEVISRVLPEVKDSTKTAILKITVLVYGVLSLFCAFFADRVGGTLFQISNAVLSVFGGAPFGMFLLGALFPFVGARAAMLACVCSTVLLLWVSIGTLLHPPEWNKPVYIGDTCPVNEVNETTVNETDAEIYSSAPMVTEDTSWFSYMYRLSPFVYSAIGTGSCVLFGLIFSLLPALREKHEIKGKYVFPITRYLFKIKDVGLCVPSQSLDCKEDPGFLNQGLELNEGEKDRDCSKNKLLRTML